MGSPIRAIAARGQTARLKGGTLSNSKAGAGAAAGIGCGSVIAGLIAWEHTHSVLWTLLRIILNWIYVIYSLISGRAHF